MLLRQCIWQKAPQYGTQRKSCRVKYKLECFSLAGPTSLV